MVQPEIVRFNEKRLIGIERPMNFNQYTVSALWKTFLSKKHTLILKNKEELFSVAIYPSDFFENFSTQNNFYKWAVAEIEENSIIPDGMKELIIPAGDYAKFHYKGLNRDNSIYKIIFYEWLPHSVYQLDDRPHFEVLGNQYKNNSPLSEEDIYIPIKKKV